jgi:hypothetical protein
LVSGGGPCLAGASSAILMHMDKILLFMETGIGYVTAEHVEFTNEHPYQLVSTAEAEILINTGRFRTASAEELQSYYNYKVAT